MKRLVIVLLSVVASQFVSGQDYFHPEVSWGVNGGMNFSKISFLPAIKQNSLNGIVGGVTFRYVTEKYFGLQVEANLSQRGWTEAFDDPALSYTRTLNYLEIPFLTHLTFGGQKFRFIVNLGPKISFLLGDSEKGVFTPTTNPEHNKLVDNRFDYGICGGAGFEIPTKIGCFLIEGRYNYGLGDVFNNSKKDYFARSSNQVSSVHLTYLFRLKQK